MSDTHVNGGGQIEVISEIRIGAKKLKASNMNAAAPQAGEQVEPDADAIKMFVGQIPRSMDENDLRKMFEEFGPVFQLNVLRDKVTGQSKGCCFITFYTRKAALDAQNALHNIKTMAGMQHPIQMKPADSEKRNAEERKLFIGMLSRKTTEQDVRMMFGAFGQIEECTILREQSGESKGCAFITFCNKQCALNSIKAMHHSQTMEGCRHPLVVKFADTQKEKEMKKMQQVNANILSSLGALGGLNTLTPQYLALLQQAGGSQGVGASLGSLGGLNTLQLQQVLTAAASAAAALQNNPALSATLATLSSMNNVSTPVTNGQANSQTPSMSNAGDASSLGSLQQLQGLAALATMSNTSGTGLSSNLTPANIAALQQIIAAATQQQQPGAQSMPPMHNPGTSSPNSNSAPMGVSVSSPTNGAMAAAYGQNSLAGATGGMPSLGGATNGIGSSQASQPSNAMDTINQAYTGIQQYAGLSGLLNQASFPNAFNAQSAAQQLQQQANSPAGKQTEGPDGANLFIYHLPQEFADHDLLQMFLPFGTVVSAKVFIDKQTNLSKCFGFVSYDNPVSAQAAIQAMNGFQIGMKRLKVQLKRPKSDAKPY